MLGMSAAAAALPKVGFAQVPAFPKAAVIRTILRDDTPEALGGGATLFHEHMSLAPNFLTRFNELQQPLGPSMVRRPALARAVTQDAVAGRHRHRRLQALSLCRTWN